jgi:3-oxoacyl-[acyl-carrier protein] reductase
MDTSPIPALDLSRLGPPKGARLVVVGGCGGIGRTLVNAALSTGLKVAVLDLPTSLNNHPPPTACFKQVLDATDEGSVTTAFIAVENEWGGADALVNLCGFTNDFEPVGSLDAKTWDDIVAGNLRAAFLCARAALPLLEKAGGGSIVNAASGLAFKGLPGTAPYGAAKAGVIAMSKSLANETAPHIRVNVIAPGAVDTAFLRGGTSRAGDDENHPTQINIERYANATPLGRLAVTEDVVAAILFLCGNASRFMTGQVLHINGGGYMP